ncbi:hypothetical protein [Paenibacillus sp. FSL E2-0178]|uniref:hypothetical protein n=1 Tax=Paenibacillus sp. FSL E2-0178 TaxID=2921361 RepID=UPI00315951D5
MATQEIGIPLDLSLGTHNNTEFLNGKLQLVEIAKADSGISIFPPEGYWISEVIRIADKVTHFKYIAKTLTGTGNYTIYTQSSQDSFTWTDWEQVSITTGAITTPVGYYARVKIVISPIRSNETFTIDGFDVNGKYNNSYINSTSGVLELKTVYANKYDLDTTWTSEGKMMSGNIPKSSFKKIDKLSLLEKG